MRRALVSRAARGALSFAGGALLICALIGCAPRSLLLVTQYGDDSPRVAEMTGAINGRLKAENVPYQLRVYNLNLVGHVSDVWRQEEARQAVLRANAAGPAVIFVAGDDAARYFAQKIVDMPRRFIFLDLVGAPSDYNLVASPKNEITGVVTDVPVQELFALMKEMAPNAKAAAVLSDDSLQGNAIIASIQSAGNLPIPVTLVKRAHTLAEWMAAVQDAQTKANVLVIASCLEVRKDAKSEVTVPQAELLQATGQVNRLPDFSFSKETVAGPNGVLGAVTVPVADQARIAAGMAADVMYYGGNLRNMPVVRCNNRETVLSADRAAQLGLNLPGIPPATLAVAIPEPNPKPEVTPPAEPSPAKPEVTPPAEPAVLPEPVTPPASASSRIIKYTVKSGDSLGSIAKKFYGDARKWKVIYDANKDLIGNNPDRLKVKMELVIPDVGAGGSAVPKPAPAPPHGK